MTELSEFLTHFPHSVEGLLLAFGSGFLVVWMLSKSASLTSTKDSNVWSRRILNFRLLLKTINPAVALLMFALGWASHDIRHYGNIRTYQNVEVAKAYGPYHYDLMIGYSVYPVDICQDGPSPNWQSGETLTVLQYEQKSGCKRLYGPDLRFVELTDARTGKLILKKEISNGEQR